MKKGFTFIESIIVVSILSMLVLIAIPRFIGYIEMSKAFVCRSNCKNLEIMYENSLHDPLDSDSLFIEFKEKYNKDICPNNGIITYENGKVKCSFHTNDLEDEEEIPYI